MKKVFVLLAISIFVIGCQEEGVSPQSDVNQFSKQIDQKLLITIDPKFKTGREGLRADNSKNDPVLDLMIQINNALAGQGVRLEKIEFLGANEEGRTVFFSDKGNQQLNSDFVPNDPRNIGGASVPYWIDNTQLGTTSGMSEQATFDAMVNSMNTWDAVTCSQGLSIPFIGVLGFDVGLVQFLVGNGGFAGYIPGTILHAGILSPDFFEAVLGPGAGAGVIGVTFTFTWADDVTFEPSDIDGNGKIDTAFSEIYINDNFNFQDAANDILFDDVVDFETVVLHEVGHGLSQGHFGTAFSDKGTGALHFSPAALMNAGYTVGRRAVVRTDKSGHCSIWEDWPSN
jgi:hypothetical protein